MGLDSSAVVGRARNRKQSAAGASSAASAAAVANIDSDYEEEPSDDDESDDETYALPATHKAARAGISFSALTVRRAKRAAPQNRDGRWCPSCGKTIASGPASSRIIQPSERSNYQRNYQLDHFPDTIAKRDGILGSGGTWTGTDGVPHTIDLAQVRAGNSDARAAYTRMYNTDVRLQCQTCNLSHNFEGVDGGYLTEDEDGNPAGGRYSTTTEAADSDEEINARNEIRRLNRERRGRGGSSSGRGRGRGRGGGSGSGGGGGGGGGGAGGPAAGKSPASKSSM
jgi:hypothetical protein